MEWAATDTVKLLYFIGESHSLVFSDLLVRDDLSDQVFMTRARYTSHVTSGNYCGATGELNPDLIDVLRSEGLLNLDGTAAHVACSPSNAAAAYLSSRPLISPPLILFFGDVDLFIQLFPQMATAYDFILPDAPFYPVDPTKKMVPLAVVQTGLERILAPFFEGVKRFKTMGFDRLMIHALPPRSLDRSAVKFSTGGYDCSIPVMYKITILCNRLLRRFCEQEQVAFIDIWPDITRDGWIVPGYMLDGAHLNRDAAQISLRKIIDSLLDTTALSFNPRRHRCAQAEASPPSPSEIGTEQACFAESGWSCDRLPDAALIPLKQHLPPLLLPVDNHLARLTWTGWHRHSSCPFLRTGAFTAEFLELAHRLLFSGAAASPLSACAPYDLTVISIRPLAVLPAQNEGARALPPPLATPPGGRRGVLVLSGSVDVTIWETNGDENADGSTSRMVATAGTLILFDGNRVSCRLERPPKGETILLDMAIAPRLHGQPPRVVWAGMNDWPCDPYHYAVNGMTAFPPFPSDMVTSLPAAQPSWREEGGVWRQASGVDSSAIIRE